MFERHQRRRSHLVSTLTKAVPGRINTGRAMEMPDLNHTLLLIIAVLVSLTRLVRLVFVVLRVCVKEYCELRNWLRAYLRRGARGIGRLHPGPGGHEGDHERDDPAAGDGSADIRGHRHDERDEPSHHVTADASRPLTPTAVQR